MRAREEPVVEATIEGPFEPEGNDHDRGQLIQIVLNVRRGVDLLLARRDVDPQRIGFVGHSNGANIGGVLAGVEKRIKAYVLMSGSAETSKDLAQSIVIKDTAQKARYLALMAQLDPINFIGHAAPAALFFQNAQHDDFVPQQDATAFQQAGSEPKLIKWYEAGHMLDLDAQRDRAEWLRVKLNLTSVP